MDIDLDDYDWDESADGIEELLRIYYPELFGLAYRDADTALPVKVSFDVNNKHIKKTIDERAKLIRGVADTTRADIRKLIDRATEEGWSNGELAKQIRAQGDIEAPRRALLIARTETATAYNLGGLLAYEEADVNEVDVEDGDGDQVCADADGQRWTIEQARANPIAHPGCVRSFSPVVE